MRGCLIGLEVHSIGLRPLPGAHILDAEGGGQVVVVGHSEPFRHGLAIEDETQGLVPTVDATKGMSLPMKFRWLDRLMCGKSPIR